MTDDISARFSGVSAAPPGWHSIVAFVGAFVGATVSVWSTQKDEPVGIAVGATLCLLFIYAALDAFTTRLWISGDRLYIKDRVLRIRSFGVQEIQSVTYIPGELFEIHFSVDRKIQFPAGSKNLGGLCEILAAHVDNQQNDS